MNHKELDGLIALLRVATPGHVKAGRECVYVDTGHAVGDPDAPDTRIASCGDADAEAFAALRNAAPDLIGMASATIDALAELERVKDRYEDALQRLARAEVGRDTWRRAATNLADAVTRAGDWDDRTRVGVALAEVESLECAAGAER